MPAPITASHAVCFQYKVTHAGLGRADRHADSDFARLLLHHIGDHGEKAKRGQQDGQRGQPAEQCDGHGPIAQRARKSITEWVHRADRLVRIDGLQHSRHGFTYGRHRVARVDQQFHVKKRHLRVWHIDRRRRVFIDPSAHIGHHAHNAARFFLAVYVLRVSTISCPRGSLPGQYFSAMALLITHTCSVSPRSVSAIKRPRSRGKFRAESICESERRRATS